jgi:hypothetical protein
MNHLVGQAVAQAACGQQQAGWVRTHAGWVRTHAGWVRTQATRPSIVRGSHTGWGVVPAFHTQPEGQNWCMETSYKCCDANGNPYPFTYFKQC